MKIRRIPSALAALGLLTGALVLSGAHLEWPALSHAHAIYLEKPAPAPAPKAIADVKNFGEAFSQLSEQMSPTVVNIYTKSGFKPQAMKSNLPPELEDQFRNYFGMGGLPMMQIPQMKVEALGSGFVINAEEGYIVTNAHVVKQNGQMADEIMVKFIGEDSSKGHAAKVVGADEISDVALLKLVEKKAGLKAAALGDSSKSKVGEWVLAIGNPYGHTHTVTQGIISALGRNLDGVRSEFLQTSASINPGNSGGPLINMNGEVIGINSVIDPRAQNIGFAIPINTAKEVIGQLVDGGHMHRAWMGVGIADLNEEAAGLLHLKESEGVLVKEVLASAPAAKAGMEPYDVIRKIDGQEVHNTRELFKSLEKLAVGKVADVEVLRGGASKTIKIKMGEQPSNS